MRDGLPVAVVSGVGKLGASSLVEKLSESDIKVIAVGEFESKLSLLTQVVVREDWPEDMSMVDYVFDFVGDPGSWSRLTSNNTKLAVVKVNGDDGVGVELGDGFNWRVIRAHGVIGRGVDLDKNNREIGFLVQAMELAVSNSNLIMPGRNTKLRVLGESSLVDAIMRATFLSSTSGNTYDVWGGEVSSESIAAWLIDEAKMTRSKVLESDERQVLPDDDYVLSEWKRLRWSPNSDLEASVASALQYLFAKVDEENRKPKQKKTKTEIVVEKVNEDHQNKLEVVVEDRVKVEVVDMEDDVVEEVVKNEDLQKEDLPKETIDRSADISNIMKEEYGDIVNEKKNEEEIEIVPLLVKNSNNRMVKQVESHPVEVIEREDNVKIISEPKIESVKDKAKTPKIDIKKTRWSWKISSKWLWLGLVIVAGIGLAAVMGWGYDNYRMVKNVYGIGELVNEKEYEDAENMAKLTLVRIRSNQNLIEKWQWNRFIWGRRYQETLKALEQGVKLEQEAVVIAKQVDLLNDGMFNEKDVDWNKELTVLKTRLEEVRATLALLSARLSGDWSWIPNRWRGDFTEAKTKVSELGGVMTKATKAMDFLPEMLGADGKRREFLVLLQNESELRPNGGFIGSYGILSFEGGKLLNFEISDIYEADGQLKGHVEPPEAIKKYLGEAKWYMRDANWQADFGASAKDLQWFLEKETGRKVDGVIGVDLAVAKSILGVTGEIYVPDFKEKINKNNLYEQAEFYSETKFFPGSNQKASFLGGLGRQLFDEIKGLKGEKRMKLVLALIDMLERNELQLSVNDAKANKVVAELGWSGAVYEGKCAVERCFADYLYVVEANLGVNKANYFLYRSIDQTVDLGLKTIGRVVKISYENTAKNNSWPGGDYKNYLRVYIPASANLAEVSVTDIEADGVKTIFSGENLNVVTSKGKKEVGFLVEVPAGKKRVVELRYVNQVDLTNKDKFSYLHYVQRQPGFGDTGMVTLVTLPSGWQVNQVEPSASLVGEKLLFNQKLDRDIKMGVEISK